jgi:hypothetical protein
VIPAAVVVRAGRQRVLGIVKRYRVAAINALVCSLTWLLAYVVCHYISPPFAIILHLMGEKGKKKAHHETAS